MADIEFNCPKCQHRLAVDERGAGKRVTCPKCDGMLTIPIPTDSEDEISCPNCGAFRPTHDAMFCMKCGASFQEQQSSEPPPINHSLKLKSVAHPQASPVAINNTRTCMYCGDEIAPDALGCTGCGKDFRPAVMRPEHNSKKPYASENMSAIGLGVLGAIILSIAVFTPLIKIPPIFNMAGTPCLFNVARSQSIVLLILAGCSIFICLMQEPRWLWLTILGSAAVLFWAYSDWTAMLTSMIEAFGVPKEEIAKALKEAEIPWAWGVLFLAVGFGLQIYALISSIQQPPTTLIIIFMGIFVICCLIYTGNWLKAKIPYRHRPSREEIRVSEQRERERASAPVPATPQVSEPKPRMNMTLEEYVRARLPKGYYAGYGCGIKLGKDDRNNGTGENVLLKSRNPSMARSLLEECHIEMRSDEEGNFWEGYEDGYQYGRNYLKVGRFRQVGTEGYEAGYR